MTAPTPCPATTRLRSRGKTTEYRCELAVGHEGLHHSTQGETAMWGAAHAPAVDTLGTAAAPHDRFVKHGPARPDTDCWSVNIGDAGVLIRRGGPGHGPADHRPVVLALTPQDAAAMAQAILEGLTS
jgi:hypothetical protein